VAGVDWVAEEGGRPFLHPGRAASIVAWESERKLGWLGEVHPLVAREWDVPGPVAGFELDVEAVLEVTAGREDVYRDVTSFPAVLQDIAVVVPEGASAAEVEEAVRAGGGDLLAGVDVFDLYRGEQAGEGNKSLALRLEFRAPDRTLTDEEVARRREAIERELETIGGRLRA
jgi:phenylalanyl-tRNA synthetase beta chain